MSYKELVQFKKKVQTSIASIAKLEEKKSVKEKEKAAAERERQDMLIAEAIDGKQADEGKLATLLSKIESVEKEISEIDGRIALIQSSRAEALAPLLGGIKEGRNREIGKLRREADALFEDARKLGQEYLLALQKVGKTREQANALHRDFLEHAKMVNVEEFTRVGNDRHPLPEYVLFNQYTNEKLGVDTTDQKAAINGSISKATLLYQLTGELETNGSVIQTKLAKAVK